MTRDQFLHRIAAFAFMAFSALLFAGAMDSNKPVLALASFALLLCAMIVAMGA